MKTGFALFAVVLLGPFQPQPDHRQEFQVERTMVTVTSAQAVTTDKRDTLYQVRLRFRSAAADSRPVLVGIGPLDGEGELTLFVDKPRITFQTSDATLKDLQVIVTGTAAGDGVDFPELSDFAASNTYDCNCSGQNVLLDRVLKTLATYFFEGVRPQTLTPPQVVLTTFHSLDGVPPPVLGRVAVMLEYPVTVPGKGVGFRLGWVARESRRQSRNTWIPVSTEVVKAKARDYVEQVVNHLRGTS